MNQPAGSPPAPIRIRDLRYRYPGSVQDVLRIPFLDITERGLIAIIGPSGAGKTTLIELLAGTLNEPYEGSVEVLGVEWKQLTRDGDRQRHLRKIGLIPQDYGLLTDRTARQMLQQDLADSGVPREQRDQRLTAALDQVGLGTFADRQLATLSGGQLQRVAIARMLARDVQLVIADEPTANLDRDLVAAAVTIFRDLARRVPVVLITHDPQVAEGCDRTIVLQSTVGDQPAMVPAPGPARSRLFWPLAALAAVALVGGAIVTTVVLASHQHPTHGSVPVSSGQPATHAASRTGSAPPTAQAPPAGPTAGATPTNPADVVGAFFAAINQRDWPRVWQLGAKNLGFSYQQMVNGFAHTRHDDATITSTNAGLVSVLLVAVKTNGQAQIYHDTYMVSHGAITQGTQALQLTGPHVAPAFAALAGNWYGHDRILTISANGLGVAHFRMFRWCSTSPAPPCDTFGNLNIYPGGVTVFQLTGGNGNQATGYIEDASVPPASGHIGLTLNHATDSVTLTPLNQAGLTYCRPRAPAGYCGA